MAEFNAPSNEAEFDKNFAQLKPHMTKTQAYLESSRCLFCYDAPCIKACPTSIDIPLFIRQIHSGNLDGAAKTIYDSNYLGNTCGKVCPTEVLCEGACVFVEANEKPLEIGRLQTYATNQVLENDKDLFTIPETGKYKVAVIGAGPAGLACACELRLHGVAVDIYEAKTKASGLVSHGVAPYKIQNEEAWLETDYLERKFGFRIFYGHPVTEATQIKYLEDNYDAVFIGTGLGKTSQMGIPGEHLQNVFGAVELIEKLREQKSKLHFPDNVVVLGGGNTAMDAASEAARMGAKEVTLVYRRSKNEMGAYEFEYDLAKSVGVKAIFNAAPVEILGDEKAKGIKFIRTKEVQGKVEPIAGTEFVLDCDWVVKATGQEKHRNLFSLIQGLHTDAAGKLLVDAASYRCMATKYFAGGDAVSGGQEVVNAAAEGKQAAFGILTFLNKE